MYLFEKVSLLSLWYLDVRVISINYLMTFVWMDQPHRLSTVELALRGYPGSPAGLCGCSPAPGLLSSKAARSVDITLLTPTTAETLVWGLNWANSPLL